MNTVLLIIGAALVFAIGDGIGILALRADATHEIALGAKSIVTLIGGMLLGKAYL